MFILSLNQLDRNTCDLICEEVVGDTTHIGF